MSVVIIKWNVCFSLFPAKKYRQKFIFSKYEKLSRKYYSIVLGNKRMLIAAEICNNRRCFLQSEQKNKKLGQTFIPLKKYKNSQNIF